MQDGAISHFSLLLEFVALFTVLIITCMAVATKGPKMDPSHRVLHAVLSGHSLCPRRLLMM